MLSGSVEFQQTIARPAVCAGVGVHSGKKAKLVLKPAPAGTGVVFRRTDVKSGDTAIQADAEYVSDTQLGTTLTNDDGVSVAVVEHLMAARQVDLTKSAAIAVAPHSHPGSDRD